MPALVLLSVCTAAPHRCRAQGHGPGQVEVATVLKGPVAPTIELVGTVRPKLRSTVAAAVDGLVSELPIDEGDFVSKGALLCRLDAAPRRYAHAEALARVAELKAERAVREAELKKAQFESNRTEALWKLQRSTDKERSDALADLEAAQARAQQAGFAVEAARAVVDRLAYDLARTEIDAPFAGYVTKKETEVGAWVDQGGSVLTLLDLSTVRVRVNVPEACIGFCRVGADAHVTIEALGLDLPARISRVIPDADPQARTFPIEIDIPNPEARLKAGMFVRAQVPAGPKAEQLLVPKDAVVRRGPLPLIYLVRTTEQGQMAESLPVRVLSEVLDYVAVQAAGLAAGQAVVVRGNEFLMGPGPVIARPSPDARGLPGLPDSRAGPPSPEPTGPSPTDVKAEQDRPGGRSGGPTRGG